ncbi:MAG: thioesterase family protein [Firmicutes bacterium]|nr:thioesterase family protein [Bacillota bacterium]
MLQVGAQHTFEKLTEPKESAAAVASGALNVFSTPSLVALFERTALEAVDPHLPAGQGTVGMEVAVKHLKATPIGQKVRCTVTLTAVEGRRLRFSGEMWDEQGRIGEGTHTRGVVNQQEFMQRVGA